MGKSMEKHVGTCRSMRTQVKPKALPKALVSSARTMPKAFALYLGFTSEGSIDVFSEIWQDVLTHDFFITE